MSKVLPILKYPNPTLRMKSELVEQIDGDIVALVEDMFETVVAAPGAGLAAIQVGVPLRIFVLNFTNPPRLEVFINPEIVKREGTQRLQGEGCLSVPDQRVSKERAQTVRVRARNLFGETFEYEASDFWAVAIQHEYDHLDGVLLIDD